MNERVLVESLPVGIPEDAFLEVFSNRERYEVSDIPLAESEVREGLSDEVIASITADELLGLISTKAYRLAIDWETGGHVYYDKRIRKPIWPGGVSGVTVGVGYDLGYHERSDILADWRPYLSPPNLEKLLNVSGLKGEPARLAAEGLKDIVISWEAGEAVFVKATLPKYARLVLKNLAHARELHPHAFGVLFSLVMNRGPSFYKDGPQFAEMRNIREHMRGRNFDKVPAELLAMKRLWPAALQGLLKRRDEEAELFRLGLSNQPLEFGTTAAEFYSNTIPAEEAREDLERSVSAEAAQEPLPPNYRGPRYEPGDVRWTSDDTINPDYCHITDRRLSGSAFNLTATALELLIGANRFKPRRDGMRILFALRGAVLADEGANVDVESLRLREIRPDHRNLRCVIGVYNTATKRLSGFPASTVPNAEAVHGSWLRHATRKPLRGNLLTTGCYPYIAGSHGSPSVSGCFIQGAGLAEEQRARVVVLRSLKDVTIDTGDFWHACRPHDNLHPAFRREGFLSEGCLTVRGTFENGSHIGDFAALRHAAGVNGVLADGTAIDLVLVTGLEAAIAASLVSRGLAADSTVAHEKLARLRQGSEGEEVKRLQKSLQRLESGRLDADDRMKLIDFQLQTIGSADGVYSMESERKFGIGVFGQRPASFLASSEGAFASSAEAASNVAPVPPGSAAERMEVLLRSDDDSLLYEVGLRARLAADRPETASAVNVALPESASAEFSFLDFKDIGLRLLSQVQAMILPVVCGERAEDQQMREEIRNAIGHHVGIEDQSDAAVGLAKVLVARLGIIPAIAQPIAALLIARVFKTTLEETCQNWHQAASVPAATVAVAEPPRAPEFSVSNTDAASIARTGAAAAQSSSYSDAEIAKLLELPEESLLQTIGKGSTMASAQREPADDAEAAMPEGFFDFLQIGQNVFQRVERDVYDIICGDSTHENEVRQHFWELLSQATSINDRKAAVSALASVIIGSMGMLPAVAIPVAIIILTRVFNSGIQNACVLWKARLEGQA